MKTDKVPPKGKKNADKPAKKPAGPKLVAKDIKPGIGHNSGEVVPELKKLVSEILASGVRQKNEGKLQRDLRNRAKTEFGITANVLSEEIKKQKMDSDVRVQYEMGQEDIKKMLGYQPQLDFVGAKPTQASLKAQPKEDELNPDPEDSHEVHDADEDGEEDHTSGDDVDLTPPEFLRRNKDAAGKAPAAGKDVIEREG